MAVERKLAPTNKANAKPQGNALLKKPDGSIYMQLSSTPFDATKDGETRTAITSNGYASIMRKIN
jgi:hypothetical protein